MVGFIGVFISYDASQIFCGFGQWFGWGIVLFGNNFIKL